MNRGGRGGGNGAKALPDMDSNHDQRLQRPLCYPYTIGQVKTHHSRPKAGWWQAGSVNRLR